MEALPLASTDFAAGDPSTVFVELLDRERMQRLLESFCDSVGIAAAIIDLQGKVLVGARWQRICTDFHRQEQRSCARCIESDTVLASRLSEGRPFSVYECRNGLTDAASPIVIEGQHVANAFVGQFLLEPPDLVHFRQQAADCGFDETVYLAALAEVPIVPREKLPAILGFLTSFASLVAEMSLDRLRALRATQSLEIRAEELAVANRKLRLTQYALDHTAEAAYWFRTDGVVVDVNNAACRQLEYKREELLELAVPDIDSDWTPEFYESLLERLKRLGNITFETHHRRKGGTIFPVEVNANCLSFEGREFIFALATDITERKKVEKAIKREKAFTESVINAQRDTFFVLNPQNGKAVLWNRAFEEISGYSHEETASLKAPDSYYDEEDLRQAARTVEEVLAAGEASVVLSLICKDGRRVLTEYSVSAVVDPHTGERLLVSIGRDITERKRAEEERLRLERQVQHAQKLESLGVLAGGIAHDFNNILMAVLGYADLAMQDLSATHPARPSVRQIEAGARRAAELAKQMLAYSGKGKFVIKAMDLSALVDDMAHLLRTSISRMITLRLELERHLPPIEADAAQLQQIVMNLITNAAEAIGDQVGVIVLATGVMECSAETLESCLVARMFPDSLLPPGLYVCLEVKDTGCGMDEEVKARLFDPFFTTKFTGRGLGMAAVLGIVRGHNGAILLDTEIGKGTSFKVLFPAVNDNSEDKSRTEAAETSDWAQGGTILVVDDEEVVRQLTTKILKRQGFAVLTAVDGREAVEVFREHADKVTCILLDLTMPRMGGEQCFEELRRISSDVKVILSSGYSEQEVAERFSGKGLAGFIQKPYWSSVLLAKLKEVLE